MRQRLLEVKDDVVEPRELLLRVAETPNRLRLGSCSRTCNVPGPEQAASDSRGLRSLREDDTNLSLERLHRNAIPRGSAHCEGEANALGWVPRKRSDAWHLLNQPDSQ